MRRQNHTRAPGGVRRGIVFVATSVALSGCVGTIEGDEPLGADRQAAIVSNAIVSNAIVSNAIVSNAIVSNAIVSNAIVSNAIVSNGVLVGAVADAQVANALEDPLARVFMQYFVSCALEPGQAVTWTSRRGRSFTWTGAMALCPTWMTSAPDEDCQELVSACLLARNNAFGEPVQLSTRGHDAYGPIQLGHEVPTFAWKTGGAAVASLEPCAGKTWGARRDCGFAAGRVGMCTPGDAVELEVTCSAPGGAPAAGAFRVCDGQNGCDAGDPAQLALAEDDCANTPRLAFTCPASGHFNWMTGHADGVSPLVASARAVSKGASAPAPEAQVFRWREGAFYGNLFGAKNLAPDHPEVRVNPETGAIEERLPGEDFWRKGREATESYQGVVFPQMWACWSSNWKYPDAYLLRRVCAGHNPHLCLATPVGPCEQLCATDDDGPGGDHDFQGCSDGGKRDYWHALTPVLAAPCDLMPGDPACTTASSTPDLGW